ncbi:MetQ/NlpA family ABC transporter substrate-binding protein [Nocardia sp. NPDC004568]|uniref:MetQ/NlpA family ABC transporter substrate-binding protein n=1 Tax=Nocardia sp. NPDC004568 TaxID=3154551 RepID=UPI0033B8A151
MVPIRTTSESASLPPQPVRASAAATANAGIANTRGNFNACSRILVAVWTRPSKRWVHGPGNGWDWAERNPGRSGRDRLVCARCEVCVVSPLSRSCSRWPRSCPPVVRTAFVDDTFASPAGLTADDVLYTDDPRRPELTQYINVFAARAEDKDDPTLLALAELYHDPAVEAAIRAESGYDGIFENNDPAELRATLAELEATFRGRSGPP